MGAFASLLSATTQLARSRPRSSFSGCFGSWCVSLGPSGTQRFLKTRCLRKGPKPKRGPCPRHGFRGCPMAIGQGPGEDVRGVPMARLKTRAPPTNRPSCPEAILGMPSPSTPPADGLGRRPRRWCSWGAASGWKRTSFWTASGSLFLLCGGPLQARQTGGFQKSYLVWLCRGPYIALWSVDAWLAPAGSPLACDPRTAPPSPLRAEAVCQPWWRRPAGRAADQAAARPLRVGTVETGPAEEAITVYQERLPTSVSSMSTRTLCGCTKLAISSRSNDDAVCVLANLMFLLCIQHMSCFYAWPLWYICVN